jgi:proteic killer suppression protein
VDIRSIRHKGLRRFVDDGDGSGLPAPYLAKLRRIVTFLQDMGSESELHDLATWKVHTLTGDRKGTYALHVSPNWRLTFRIDGAEIADLDFEDYH